MSVQAALLMMVLCLPDATAQLAHTFVTAATTVASFGGWMLNVLWSSDRDDILMVRVLSVRSCKSAIGSVLLPT